MLNLNKLNKYKGVVEMIDEKTVDWIANLARLELNEDEKKEMSSQLTKILDYMDVLNELDLENVEITAHTLDLKNVMREDKVRKSFDTEEVEKLAPEWQNNHFVVPRII